MAPFCGTPVRPNMLNMPNMPKSASGGGSGSNFSGVRGIAYLLSQPKMLLYTFSSPFLCFLLLSLPFLFRFSLSIHPSPFAPSTFLSPFYLSPPCPQISALSLSLSCPSLSLLLPADPAKGLWTAWSFSKMSLEDPRSKLNLRQFTYKV